MEIGPITIEPICESRFTTVRLFENKKVSNFESDHVFEWTRFNSAERTKWRQLNLR